MNKAGSYIEPEDQPVYYYNYRDYPKVPQPRTGYLQLSQSIEEEPLDTTINTQGTYDQPVDKSVIDVYLRLKPSKSKSNPTNVIISSFTIFFTKLTRVLIHPNPNVYRVSKEQI